MSLYEICIRRPVFATMLILSLVVMGLASFGKLGLDIFPKVDLPTVTITTRLEGASPEEIESQITKPIEEVVNTISGIDELRSTTIEGQSQIYATFLLEKDINVAANEVRDKVSTILSTLPLGTDSPVIEKADPDASPIMSLVVSGKRSAREVTEIADKKIKRQLEVIENMGAITLVGHRQREVQVVIDPNRLIAYNLSIVNVKEALKRQNVEIPGGRITWDAREQGLRTMGRLEDVNEFNDLIVADFKGAPVRVKDIGYAIDTEEEPRSISRLDGNNAVSMLVRKQSGTNTVKVVDDVKAKLAEIKATLPPDIDIQVVTDQSKFIKKSISQVEEHLVLGSILASLIILLFIKNWRTAFIAALAIPASIIGTFTILRYMGFTLNNMTLLALSVCTGIVIDDAIIVLENIFRHMEEEGRSPVEAAIHGTKEIALAVMATTLSLVVIFLPVAFMSGLVGRFWKSFGLTATFAIMISLLVSFTLTPMLSARLLKHKGGEKKKDSKLYSKMEASYLWLLSWCLRHRIVAIIAAIAIFFSVVPLFKIAKAEFIVDDDMSEFEVVVETPPGSSLAKTDEILKGVEAEIAKIPEVVHVFTTIGVRGQYLSNVTDSSIYVGLKHLSERQRTQGELMQEARILLQKFPNLRISVQNINLISGGGFKATPFNLVIRGPELQKLDEYSSKLIQSLKAIPGFVDTDTGQAYKHPELQVYIDRKKASDLGVKVDSIATSLRTMVGGEKVTLFREGDEQYDVRLRLADTYRSNAEAIEQLSVPNNEGKLIKLNNFATLTPGTSPGQIDRYSQERQITVISNLNMLPLGEAVTRANEAVADMNMPAEYSTTYLGRGKLMKDAFQNFLIAFVLSLIFIYMVLAAQFESFVHPITIMVSIFLSIPFGILSIILAGSTVNIYSVMGLFILIGVVKKNAILQIDYTNTLRGRGMERYAAQMEANRVRLRPILMTTLAIIAGMLPVTLGKGDGSSSRASMAVVIVGGQALCLLVTLVIIPVVYSAFDDLRGFGYFKKVRFPWRRNSVVNEDNYTNV
ncbi:MAG: efflux RND transporter permease subunit [Deltaproteobacteria bacterium]|nr:efflux RND transporter permease subunit [Deltaproteobacteria bacterium]